MKEYAASKKRESRTIDPKIDNGKKQNSNTVNVFAPIQRVPDWNMINQFGAIHRNVLIDTNVFDNQNVRNPPGRIDDVPSVTLFTQIYNNLQNIKLYMEYVSTPQDYANFLNFTDVDHSNTYVGDLKILATKYKADYRTFNQNALNNLQPGGYENNLRDNYELEVHRYVLLMLDIYDTCNIYLQNIQQTPIESTIDIGTDVWREKWLTAIENVNVILRMSWDMYRPIIIAEMQRKYQILAPNTNINHNLFNHLRLSYIGSTATGYKGPPKQRIQFDPNLFDVDANIDAPLLARYALNIDNLSPDRNRIFARKTSIQSLIAFCDEVNGLLQDNVPGIDMYDTFDIAIDCADTAATTFDHEWQELLYMIRENNPNQFTTVLESLF